MSFLGDNMTPLGGNSRAGRNPEKNTPMGWAYQSSTDSLADVQGVGYFDTFNISLVAGQFIYASLTDGKFIFTVFSSDVNLKQVTLDSAVFFPTSGVAPGIDDVLEVGQLITGNKQIAGEASSSTLALNFTDAPLSSFTKFAQIFIEPEIALLSVSQGDGAGNFTGTRAISIDDSTGMVVADTVENKGLVYAADYTDQFVPLSLVDKNYSDFKSRLAQTVQTTGVLEGLALSDATLTTFDISAGSGIIARYTDPSNPVVTVVEFAGVDDYVALNLNQGLIRLGLDINGNIVEKAVLTTQDLRETIWFGGYVSLVGPPAIDLIDSPENLGFEGIASVKDYIKDVIGPATITGNIISASSNASLEIANTGGLVYIPEANFRNNPEVPDELLISADDPITGFFYGFRDAGTGIILGIPTTLIDPDNYDDGSGTLQPVPNNSFSVQVIYITAEVLYGVAYGQETFNTLSTAESAVLGGTLEFEERGVFTQLVRRSFMVVKEGTTDLNNTSNVTFFADGKFRGGGVSTGGTPGVTLPGGANTNVQFNDSGFFGGDSGFTYTKATSDVLIGGQLTLGAGLGVLISDIGENVTFRDNASAITGTLNTVMGGNTSTSIITGEGNAIYGYKAGDSVTSGDDNVLVGMSAADELTTGVDNICLGRESGTGLITGSRNILIGDNTAVPAAGTNDFLNIGDLIFGDLAGQFVRIGGSLGTVPGPEVLRVEGPLSIQGTLILDRQGSFDDNILLSISGAPVTTGRRNILIGVYTGAGPDITGDENIILGHIAGADLTSGSENILIGDSVAQSITTGSQNTIVGGLAGMGLTVGLRNTIIGDQAGQTVVGGDDNIIIGMGADTPAAGTNEFLNIGGLIFAQLANDRVRIGGVVGDAFSASAGLELFDDDMALRLNRVTTTNEGTMTLQNGMIWYNSTSNTLRARVNGATGTIDFTAD